MSNELCSFFFIGGKMGWVELLVDTAGIVDTTQFYIQLRGFRIIHVHYGWCWAGSAMNGLALIMQADNLKIISIVDLIIDSR